MKYKISGLVVIIATVSTAYGCYTDFWQKCESVGRDCPLGTLDNNGKVRHSLCTSDDDMHLNTPTSSGAKSLMPSNGSCHMVCSYDNGRGGSIGCGEYDKDWSNFQPDWESGICSGS
jgi:hypothetical protein